MTRPLALPRSRFLSIAAAGLAAAMALGVALTAAPRTEAAPGRAFASQLAFHDAMRKLWEDHIVWTRQFIVSAATLPDTTLPDVDPTVARLLENQAAIGDALGAFYGDAAGDALTALLREHILTAAELLVAAKAGDADAIADASARWYANADDIAAALHALNPANWPLAELRAHMREHLDLTLEEALARLAGHYAADIAAYDEIHAQILAMADMLSDGIIAQFPAKFAR